MQFSMNTAFQGERQFEEDIFFDYGWVHAARNDERRLQSSFSAYWKCVAK
jgi:hypothetical protein